MTLPSDWRDTIVSAPPALLLALFALRAGTFEGATVGWWAVIGHAALIAFALIGVSSWRDPLGLGRRHGLLVAGLIGWTTVTCAASPVSRAGWVGVLVLPAFLLIPAAVARCWSTARQRTIGMAGLAMVLMVASLWALVAWGMGLGERPALPLGHHNLLATFVVMLLPMTLPLVRRRGLFRVLGLGAGLLGVATVVASRSLAGAIALLVVILVALPRRRGALAALALVTVALIQAPRLTHVLLGDDTSLHARRAYARAALDGIAARPLLGWGPGAAPWTIADHLPPQPGVLPAGQVIGHLHNLPLHLTYELGLPGLALVLALIVLLARRAAGRARTAEDHDARRAAAWGLLAGAVASLGGLPLSTTALPLTVAILVGLLRTTAPTGPSGASPRDRPFTTHSRWQRRDAPAIVVLVLCTLGLIRLDAGHVNYDRAVRATTDPARRLALERALRLDPRHPLYRARRAWLINDANEARRAAESAQGVAALWLAAGSMGLEARAHWAQDALDRVCRLDPLGPMAPFLLGIDLAHDDAAPSRLARAVAADPRLLIARAFQGSRHQNAVATRIDRAGGLDTYWRDAARQRLLTAQTDASPIDATASSTAALTLSMDNNASTSLSLVGFRRQPWPTTLVAITLRGDPDGATALGAAADRRDTDPRVFAGESCTLGSRPIPNDESAPTRARP